MPLKRLDILLNSSFYGVLEVMFIVGWKLDAVLWESVLLKPLNEDFCDKEGFNGESVNLETKQAVERRHSCLLITIRKYYEKVIGS